MKVTKAQLEKVGADARRKAEKETKELGAVLSFQTDPVLRVLKVHLLCEQYLERFLRVKLPRGDRLLDKTRLNFSAKLSIVDSFDTIPDAVITSVKKLNAIRNDCAHNKDKRIEQADLDSLGNSMGAKYRQFRDESTSIDQLMALTFIQIFEDLYTPLATAEAIEQVEREAKDIVDETAKSNGGK